MTANKAVISQTVIFRTTKNVGVVGATMREKERNLHFNKVRTFNKEIRSNRNRRRKSRIGETSFN